MEDDISISRGVKEGHESNISHESSETALMDNPYLMAMCLSTKQGQKRHLETSKGLPTEEKLISLRRTLEGS